ncbi:MAG: hypothetical protein JW816_02525 [Candidatus Buchananbacteria bacterium]|nr:hypothetical protein [Candidatus Buchananbacteria bacterium]
MPSPETSNQPILDPDNVESAIDKIFDNESEPEETDAITQEILKDRRNEEVAKAKEKDKIRERLNEIYIKYTAKPLDIPTEEVQSVAKDAMEYMKLFKPEENPGLYQFATETIRAANLE